VYAGGAIAISVVEFFHFFPPRAIVARLHLDAFLLLFSSLFFSYNSLQSSDRPTGASSQPTSNRSRCAVNAQMASFLSLSLSLSLYIYIYISLSLSLYIYIYIYIYLFDPSSEDRLEKNFSFRLPFPDLHNTSAANESAVGALIAPTHCNFLRALIRSNRRCYLHKRTAISVIPRTYARIIAHTIFPLRYRFGMTEMRLLRNAFPLEMQG